MKRNFNAVVRMFAVGLVMSLLVCFVSCASTPAAVSNSIEEVRQYPELIPEGPEYDYYTGQYLDVLWGMFYETGSEEYFKLILSYCNTEDLTMKILNEKYDQVLQDENLCEFLEILGAEFSDTGVSLSFDIEDLVGNLVQNPYYNSYVRNLFTYLPQDVVIRAVMKSTAYWSITAQSDYDDTIQYLLEKNLPFVYSKCRAVFNDSQNYFAPAIYSESGVASYRGDDMTILVSLVDDLDSVYLQWQELTVNEAPVVKTVTTVNANSGNIYPFIAYSVKGQEEFPVYYSCTLVDSEGHSYSMNDVDLNLCSVAKEKTSYFYAAEETTGFGFRDDNTGLCRLQIVVYTDSKVIAAFELPFVVE